MPSQLVQASDRGLTNRPITLSARMTVATEAESANPPHGRRHYLYPGHLYVASEASSVTTILGSCVAVCLYDDLAGVGGLNHYLLPFWAGQGEASARYGNISVDLLSREVVEAGAHYHRLQAKLFGGAGLIGSRADGHHLGTKNVDMARELLASLGIPIVAEDVGGNKGRKLIFHTDTGAAWVRKL